MRAFDFSLRQALAWRKTQQELEEAKLQQLFARMEELRLAGLRLEMARTRAEAAVREAAVVDARELWALAAHRERLRAEKAAVAARQTACEREISTQRDKVRDAQRQYRLLEKLEQRRWLEWRRAADLELDNLAAESYLALWNRRRG